MLMSSCSIYRSCEPLMVLMSAVISFIYSKNRRGPKTVPWGTPKVTGSQDDCDLFTTTRCSRFANNEEIQAKMLPRML